MRSEIIGMFRRGQQVRERQDHADAICRRAGHALYEIRAGWDAATRTAVLDCRIRRAAIRNGCRRPLDQRRRRKKPSSRWRYSGLMHRPEPGYDSVRNNDSGIFQAQSRGGAQFGPPSQCDQSPHRQRSGRHRCWSSRCKRNSHQRRALAAWHGRRRACARRQPQFLCCLPLGQAGGDDRRYVWSSRLAAAERLQELRQPHLSSSPAGRLSAACRKSWRFAGGANRVGIRDQCARVSAAWQGARGNAGSHARWALAAAELPHD